MVTKPAKVPHRPSWPTKAAKPGLFPVTEELLQNKVFAPRAGADQSCYYPWCQNLSLIDTLRLAG